MSDPVPVHHRVELDDVALSCIVHGVSGQDPLVIAVHGFPDDATTFAGQIPALTAAGYRVLTPTLRGYAPSGVARSGRHDAVSAARDLVALADRFSPGAPVRLVGHDWGAVAAFAATAIAPDRFSHLATIAVPHPRAITRNASAAQLRRSWYMGLFQLPFVAERRLRAHDFKLIDDLWADWSPGYRASAEELRRVKDGIAGREGPVLAYYRALRSPRSLAGEPRRLLFARTSVRALHLHGRDDGCVGVEMCRGAERDYTGSYELQVIEGAGHFLQREKPGEVSARLLAFFGAG
jgi:pimeloyl-ACP methyl ester carboxylesterase